MRVALSHNAKGKCLLATQTIKKDQILAYYKVKVVDYRTYTYPHGNTYLISIAKRNGSEHTYLIGDMYSGSDRLPSKGVPYLAQYANEPYPTETTNCYIDTLSAFNFRRTIREGDTVTYALRASRRIRTGEEIVWHYGDNYERDYQVGW